VTGHTVTANTIEEPSQPAKDALKTALKTAQSALMAGNADSAYDALAGLLDADSPPTDALYIAAVAQRYRKQFVGARDLLTRLLDTAPDLGKAWQEQGHLLRDQNKNADAVKAYEAAVRFNPALEASWQTLATLYAASGQAAASQQAGAQAQRLKTLPKALLAVMHHLYEGRMLKAEERCRAFLKIQPRNTEAMRLLAEIGIRMGVLDDAEILLESAVAFEPDTIQIRLDYIQLLRKRQKYADSLAQSTALYARDPENPVFLSNIAIDHMHMGNFGAAIEAFDKVLVQLPGDPVTLTSKGHALKTWGQQDAAIACYRDAASRKPDHGDAWYGLANLKTYRFSAAETDAMTAALSGPAVLPNDRIYLAFALAKSYDDSGDFQAAFSYYSMGNALKKRSNRYDSDQMHAELKTQAAIADTAFMRAAKAGGGCPAPDPIFIVGLPRAGSTLIEQILASHSQIDGTLELPHILQTVHGLRGRMGSNRYGEALAQMTDEDAHRLGAAYIEDTRQYRGNAPFFTDKMPNNFRHIGLIHRILPNARIIDARRDPVACCFSGFKQLFAEGQEFSYDLEDIGRYYRDYVDLMDHFDRAAPGLVLRVDYADVVADLEGQVRRMLDYLGLEFEHACVNFHQTDRAVRTASSEQVREKINAKGLNAWAPYSAWLGPLRTALGPLAPDQDDPPIPDTPHPDAAAAAHPMSEGQ